MNPGHSCRGQPHPHGKRWGHSAAQSWGSLLFMCTLIYLLIYLLTCWYRTTKFDVVTYGREIVFFRVQPRPCPKRAEPQCPPFGFSSIMPHPLTQNDHVWQGNVGEEHVSWGQPRLPSQGCEAPALPNFWVLLYLHLHSMTLNNQIGHGNTYGELLVFRRSSMSSIPVGHGPSEPQFWGFSPTYAYRVWHRVTLGRGTFWWSDMLLPIVQLHHAVDSQVCCLSFSFSYTLYNISSILFIRQLIQASVGIPILICCSSVGLSNTYVYFMSIPHLLFASDIGEHCVIVTIFVRVQDISNDVEGLAPHFHGLTICQFGTRFWAHLPGRRDQWKG